MAKNIKGRKFVATAATAALVASAIVPVASAAEFNDKGQIADWAKDAVAYLVSEGVLQGDNNGNFNPNGSLTRGEAATILAKALGLTIDKSKEATFADTKGHWASAAVAALQAKDASIISGFDANTFAPDQEVTRAQLAKMIVTAYGLELAPNTDVDFADDDNHWGQEFINILASNGIANGYGVNFQPENKVTRQEAAVFTHRVLEEGVRLEVEPVYTAEEAKALVEAALEDLEAAVKALPSVNAINRDNADSATEKATAVEKAIFAVEEALVFVEATEALTEEELKATEDALTAALAAVTAVKEAVLEATKPVVDLAVESVSAINSKQLLVKFSGKLNKDSILNSNGELLSGVVTLNTSDLGGTKASYNENTNELIITRTASLTKDTEYSVVVDNVLDLDAKKAPKFATAIVTNEKVAPSVKQVISLTKDEKTNVVNITFTEPVSFNSIKVNGKFVNAASADGGFNASYTLTTSELLEAGKTYDVEINGLKDGFDNAADNILKTNVTVVRDTVKPTYTVQPYGENKFLVVFDKEMSSTVAVDSFTVTKVNSITGVTQTLPQTGLAVRLGDKKSFLVSVAPGSVFDAAAQNTKEVSVTVKGLSDSLGNTMDSKTEKVTLSRDLVKPQVKSVKQVAGSQTAVEVEFTESVTGISTADFRLTTLDGKTVYNGLVPVSISAVSNVSTNTANKVTVTFDAALPATGVYKLVLVQDSVQDTSLAANKNAAQVVEFSYNKQTAAVAQLVAVITETTNGATPVDSSTNNRKVQINFSETVVTGIDSATGTYKNGAADNPANYTVNGLPLPEGTVVTASSNSAILDFTNVLAKDLPTSLAAGGSLAVAVANVKSAAGSTLAYTTKAVTVLDKTAPTITAAYIQGNEIIGYTITLTMSEGLSDAAVAEFGYVDGANIVELNSVGNTIAIDPTDATKVTISVTDSTDKANLKTKLDAVGNTVEFGITDNTVTITKDKATTPNTAAVGVVTGTNKNTVILTEFLAASMAPSTAATTADITGQVAAVTVTNADVPAGTAKVAVVAKTGSVYTAADISSAIDATAKASATSIAASPATTTVISLPLTATTYSILVAYLDASGNVIGYEIETVTLA